MSHSSLVSVGSNVTPELLALLKELFPNQCPSLGTPLEAIWYESGQASVVDFLQTAYEESTKNILSSNME